MTDKPAKKNGLAHRLYTGQISYDFVGRRKLWYLVSLIIISISLLSIAFFKLNLGIEFKGGAEFQAPTTVSQETVPKVRKAVQDLKLPDMDGLTVTTGNDNVRVQTRVLDSDTEVPKVREAIAKAAGTTSDKVDSQFIGASWGKDITQQGIVALVVFLGLVMLLIWFYFREVKMSVAAIVALMHDLIVTIGLYALAHFTFTPATLIAVLTILGYSLYDTVVVFDKVKENTKDIEKTNITYSEAANRGLNQVVVRSINTTMIGVLPVAALLVAGTFLLGTGPLKDLSLAMFIGMLAGTYSSVFIATPLLSQMKEAEPAMKQHRARIAKRAQRNGLTKAERKSQAREAAKADRSEQASNAEHNVYPEQTELEAKNTVSVAVLEGERRQPKRTSRAQRKK